MDSEERDGGAHGADATPLPGGSARPAAAPVSLSQILRGSGAGGAGAGPAPVGHTPSERAATAACIPSHQALRSNGMGHGASCLTGTSAAPSSGNGSAPLQRGANHALAPHSLSHQQQKATTASASSASTAVTTLLAGPSVHSTGSSQAASAATGHSNRAMPDDYEYLCSLVPELKGELKERETRLELYQTETLELKRRLKKRDEEIGRLQREIHKLKVSAPPSSSSPSFASACALPGSIKTSSRGKLPPINQCCLIE